MENSIVKRLDKQSSSHLCSGRSRGQRKRRHHKSIIYPHISAAWSLLVSSVDHQHRTRTAAQVAQRPENFVNIIAPLHLARSLIHALVGRCEQANERLALRSQLITIPTDKTRTLSCELF